MKPQILTPSTIAVAVSPFSTTLPCQDRALSWLGALALFNKHLSHMSSTWLHLCLTSIPSLCQQMEEGDWLSQRTELTSPETWKANEQHRGPSWPGAERGLQATAGRTEALPQPHAAKLVGSQVDVFPAEPRIRTKPQATGSCRRIRQCCALGSRPRETVRPEARHSKSSSQRFLFHSNR